METASASDRIYSIDVFRGFTMLMMVFVNDLAGISDIPAWMKHVAADADAMTFVDVVFPAFLFIVGMSIPLALRQRIKKGEDAKTIAWHLFVRTAGLLLLGFFMVNSEEMNAALNPIPKRIWGLSFLAAVIIIWNQYRYEWSDQKPWLPWLLRGIGGAVLIFLAFNFQKGTAEAPSGMTPSWWGILGLIGFAYAIAMAVYTLFKGNRTALAGMIGLFMLMVLGIKSKELVFPGWLNWLQGWGGHFAHATLVLAGALTTLFLVDGFRNERDQKNQKLLLLLVILPVLFSLAAWFVRPYLGISKINATPSWVLYCIAICSFVYGIFYWIIDVNGARSWANFLKPAGANPLLTYILPNIFYAIVGWGFWPEALSTGAAGFFRSVFFAFFILGIAAILTRYKIKLHL